ncbi:family 1 glycosylhydrolase [Bacillus velezensis]
MKNRACSLIHFYGGSASAAYQAEGAWNKDGKGPSV